MKPNAKRKNKNKKATPKTRKDLRKEQRQAKKAKKHEFFSRKKSNVSKQGTNGQELKHNLNREQPVVKPKITPEQLALERKQKAELKLRREEKELHRIRVRQLKQANFEEDKLIKKLEKNLKINKRKSKSVPKSFLEDGLDYLLDVCDRDKLSEFAAAENNLNDSDSEFEEDFAVISGKHSKTTISQEKSEKKSKKLKSGENIDPLNVVEESSKEKRRKKEKLVENYDDGEEDVKIKSKKLKRKGEDELVEAKPSKKVRFEDKYSESEEEGEEYDSMGEESAEEGHEEDEVEEAEGAEEWEDIYGRRRAKSGQVMPSAKYVPPQLRVSGVSNTRLRAQLKGLLNRLSENNMKKIADEMESIYMSHSRHDTSETMTQLLTESLIAEHAVTPDRLVAEHVMLVAILHANVGTEVGAHLLQALVNRFSSELALCSAVEDKRLDNLILSISHLYNFRVFASQLVYDILVKLAEKFGEKEVGLILLVLKTVGASLRRDDPLALKDLISRLQTQAGRVTDLANKDNSRVRFLLDVVLAIKNNNMSKIPGYDVAHVDHLKKTVKTYLRPGNSVTELKISLEDLLRADTQGRWWVVGSAWLGNEVKPLSKAAPGTNFSAQVLALAKKQRMNTEVRRNVFCIVMTAEDYLDAFEKLLHLGLKNQQLREIVHVVLDCCLQEKNFNAYYAHLTCKFCSFDRKYQMAVQYLLWDKLKELNSLSKTQMTNLAKFLAHMFLEPQGLPLSVLKVIHFSEVDKPTVRLLRQALLAMLLSESEESCRDAFTRVAGVEKLRQFRDGLRLFLHHFVLRQTKHLQPDDVERLRQRTKMADQALGSAEGSTLF